jgi:1-acyl-sn-glycerol-3-phosphate acyltransferase
MASPQHTRVSSAAPEKARLLRFLHRGRAPAWGDDPAVYDPELTAKTVERMGALFGPGRYFRLETRSLGDVPPAPAMFVSNHSGGTTIPDVWGFAIAWYRHFGTRRPLHLLGHEIILATEATGKYFARRGVVRASMQTARHILSHFRRDVLVMPGGARDTWRPWSRRYQVEFGGRTGYARLALELGVPIVPVANAGAHDTLFVLSDGRRLARAIGLHHIVRADILPIHLSLPWGIAVGAWPHLPLPVKLRFQIGEAIVSTPRQGSVPTEDEVHALDARVRAAVQAQLDQLARG